MLSGRRAREGVEMRSRQWRDTVVWMCGRWGTAPLGSFSFPSLILGHLLLTFSVRGSCIHVLMTLERPRTRASISSLPFANLLPAYSPASRSPTTPVKLSFSSVMIEFGQSLSVSHAA